MGSVRMSKAMQLPKNWDTIRPSGGPHAIPLAAASQLIQCLKGSGRPARLDWKGVPAAFANSFDGSSSAPVSFGKFDRALGKLLNQFQDLPTEVQTK